MGTSEKYGVEISVVLPTRNRKTMLFESIKSLHDNCSSVKNVEICLAIDEGTEVESLPDFKNFKKFQFNVITTQRFGYIGLHNYFNSLSQVSSGEWFFLWNDDAIMETQDWDVIIKNQSKLKVLKPIHNHRDLSTENIFPIIPKKYIELVGHVSLDGASDSWWGFVGQMSETQLEIPIEIFHRRHDLIGTKPDLTNLENNYKSNSFHSEYIQKWISIDSAKIKAYSQSQNVRFSNILKIWDFLRL
jgi:hypothetical protein